MKKAIPYLTLIFLITSNAQSDQKPVWLDCPGPACPAGHESVGKIIYGDIEVGEKKLPDVMPKGDKSSSSTRIEDLIKAEKGGFKDEASGELRMTPER